jgi:hypothetical protein
MDWCDPVHCYSLKFNRYTSSQYTHLPRPSSQVLFAFISSSHCQPLPLPALDEDALALALSFFELVGGFPLPDGALRLRLLLLAESSEGGRRDFAASEAFLMPSSSRSSRSFRMSFKCLSFPDLDWL